MYKDYFYYPQVSVSNLHKLKSVRVANIYFNITIIMITYVLLQELLAVLECTQALVSVKSTPDV